MTARKRVVRYVTSYGYAEIRPDLHAIYCEFKQSLYPSSQPTIEYVRPSDLANDVFCFTSSTSISNKMLARLASWVGTNRIDRVYPMISQIEHRLKEAKKTLNDAGWSFEGGYMFIDGFGGQIRMTPPFRCTTTTNVLIYDAPYMKIGTTKAFSCYTENDDICQSYLVVYNDGAAGVLKHVKFNRGEKLIYFGGGGRLCNADRSIDPILFDLVAEVCINKAVMRKEASILRHKYASAKQEEKNTTFPSLMHLCRNVIWRAEGGRVFKLTDYDETLTADLMEYIDVGPLRMDCNPISLPLEVATQQARP